MVGAELLGVAATGAPRSVVPVVLRKVLPGCEKPVKLRSPGAEPDWSPAAPPTSPTTLFIVSPVLPKFTDFVVLISVLLNTLLLMSLGNRYLGLSPSPWGAGAAAAKQNDGSRAERTANEAAMITEDRRTIAVMIRISMYWFLR